jgi:hypothetical protein
MIYDMNEKEKRMWESADKRATHAHPDLNFESGALWMEEDMTERIHKALKGLGLEKHSVALNVLRIAGIELPKKEK